MRLFPLIALICLAATLPPPVPKKPVKRYVEPPRGAQLLLVKPKIVLPPSPRIVTNVWRYAAKDTNLLWDLQSSTDLTNWQTIIWNATGELSVTNNKAEPGRLFRLRGRAFPIQVP